MGHNYSVNIGFIIYNYEISLSSDVRDNTPWYPMDYFARCWKINYFKV